MEYEFQPTATSSTSLPAIRKQVDKSLESVSEILNMTPESVWELAATANSIPAKLQDTEEGEQFWNDLQSLRDAEAYNLNKMLGKKP